MSSDKIKEEEKKLGSPKRETEPLAPKSPTVLSPYQKPPPRVQSSNSLFGEDIVNSGRHGEHHTEHHTIASYSDDDATTPPGSVISNISQSLSPPPLIPSAVENFLNSSSSIHSYPSFSKVKPGRPPRAPGAAFHKDPQLPVRKDSVPKDHKRVRSTGEFSFMSALTEPSDTEGERDRAVTWDEHFFDASPSGESPSVDILPPDLLQPVLMDEPPRSIRTSPPVMKSPQQRIAAATHLRDDSGKLDLSEIVSPMESEAETAILKALEERDRKLTRSSDAILPSVPDETLHNFLAPPVAVDPQQPMLDTPCSSNLEAPEVTTSPLSGSASKESVRGQSMRSVNRTPSKGSMSSRNLERQTSKKPGHRRTNTQTSGNDLTLFGLATMMRNIHHEADVDHAKDRSEDNINRARLTSHDQFVEEAISASDALANQAALLFRGKMTKESGFANLNSANDEMDPKKNDDIMEGEDWEERSNADIELGNDTQGYTEQGAQPARRKNLAGRWFKRAANAAKDDWELFNDFFGGRRKTMLSYTKAVLIYLFFPALALACLFFYVLGNPNLYAAGNDKDGYPSISWFILFLGVRQLITFSFAKMTEMIIIDFLALKTRIFIKIFGPLVSLMVVQSKGWPFLITWWACYDLCMLTGDGPFANHWLFYQNYIGVFNTENPSGNVTSSAWNFRIVIAFLIIGILVAIKRFTVGLYLGGRQYLTYGSKLATVIHKMIIISQVAGLARRIEDQHEPTGTGTTVSRKKYSQETLFKWSFRGFGSTRMLDTDDEDEDIKKTLSGGNVTGESGEEDSFNPQQYTKSLSTSARIKLTQMLDTWEEPAEERDTGKVSIQGILQFKQTLAFMDLSYPFSTAFGPADKREACVESAQEVFRCLLLPNPTSPDLDFTTLTALAMTDDNTLDESMVKDLVRVFRPDRAGKLSMMDFVRSVDRVYKDLRLLRASIINSSQIDQAFEALINIVFYFVLFCVVLACWNIDPLALFLSLSSIILAFTFAIGSASSKYFEGLMFILGRNPYDIGDRISINQVDEQPASDGVYTWYVEKVTLYYTTLRLGATNEVATVANSAMANSRIVNAARSPKALIYINLKFGIDVPYHRILLFKETVETFVKARPREWLSCSGIRCVKVEADLGYVQYVIILQHRDSWQHLSGILENKAAVISYCLEVQKQLNMRFLAPPTPVDLTVKNASLASALGVMTSSSESVNGTSPERSGSSNTRARTQSADLRRIAEMFAVQESPST
mmetsp:Transcript_26351/g.44013  ORF Transcript_26351/g.44013 Transcript_26351/m.44013 type:complete len:1247 (+) Transcript_26351:137-3877(+)